MHQEIHAVVHLADSKDVLDLRFKLVHIIHTLERLMTIISDFVAKQNAHNDKIDDSISGLQEDIAALNAEILKLQTSSGEISPEDQASLDALDARGQSIADKIEALNALTPPVPPPA